MKHKLAVLGNPIEHSLSPNIFALFSQQMQQPIDYSRMFVDTGDFEATIKHLIDDDFIGCNVTLPYKHEAFALADHHCPLSFAAKAANVLRFTQNGDVFAYNTDGIGLISALQRDYSPLQNKQILLLGAGGAAYGCVLPLLQQNPALLTVSNRTVLKAEQLVEQFLPQGPIQAVKFKDLHGKFDVIINATSTGISDTQLPLPNDIVTPETLCYEMLVNKVTPFMKWGQRLGAKTVDGLSMLVEQAVESYAIWFDQRPDSNDVLDTLAKETANLSLE